MRIRSLAVCVAVWGLGCGGSDALLRAVGEPCTPTLAPGETSTQCQDGLCVALDDASGFCTRNCEDATNCPASFVCEAAGRYGKICKPVTGCSEDSECPAGHSCNVETGNCYLRVSRTLCSPCQDSLQCPQGGACFTARGSGEQFCTTACGADDRCPEGFTCSELSVGAGGALVKQCVPVTQTCNAGKRLCAPCRGDDECGGPFDLCVRNVVSGERFCGRDCDPDRAGACPDGFSCVDIGQANDDSQDGPFQCVPNSNTCESYCDAPSEAAQVAQCGLGNECDLATHMCRAATDGRQCASCLDNDDCTSGNHPENRCLVNDCPDCPFKGESFCATECANDQACVSSFGPGFLCKPVQYESGTRNFCLPQRGTCQTGLGQLGADCSQNGAQDCVAGVCIVAGTQSFCSFTCGKDSDCGDTRYRCCEWGPNGYDCSAMHRGPEGPLDGSGVCTPLGGLFGDDCTPGRPPCQTGTCLDLGTARVCTELCSQGCPEGFSCRDAHLMGDLGAAQVSVCFPEGGGKAGASCTFGPAACESGLCIRKDSGPVCTQPCTDNSECPEDWTCEGIETVSNESVQACLPPALQ